MTRRNWGTIALVGAGLALVSLLVGLLWPAGGKTAGREQQATPGINVLVGGKGCDKVDVATRALLAQGFAEGEFTIGEDRVEWSAAEANERGENPFVTETAQSAEALVRQLAAETDASAAARDELLNQSGASKEQLLDPSNWVPAQFKVGSAWPGNTYFRGGEATPAGTRQSGVGDVVWIFVNPDKCPQATAGTLPPEEAVVAHRAGCGNPQLELPVPAKAPPPKEPPPPVTVPDRPPKVPPTTVPPPPTTQPERPSGKETPPTTVAPPPTTAPTDNQPEPERQPADQQPGRRYAGDGATNTTSPPTTEAPAEYQPKDRTNDPEGKPQEEPIG